MTRESEAIPRVEGRIEHAIVTRCKLRWSDAHKPCDAHLLFVKNQELCAET